VLVAVSRGVYHVLVIPGATARASDLYFALGESSYTSVVGVSRRFRAVRLASDTVASALTESRI